MLAYLLTCAAAAPVADATGGGAEPDVGEGKSK